jgi:nicotinamidase-related amidase
MMRWGSTDIAETLDELVEPSSTALILWDYAKGLVAHAVHREAFVANSQRLLHAARANGVTVFFSRQSDMTFADVGPGLIRLRMREMKLKSDATYVSANVKGSPQGEFIDDVQPAPGEVVFEKFLPNGFSGSNLGWRLRTRGIKTLVLAGISLETGVDGTAREAINRGYYAVIARDAVSSRSQNRLDAGLAIVEELHDVADTTAIIGAWEKAMAQKTRA